MPNEHTGITYLDFEVEISASQGDEYLLKVLHSPAGEATAAFNLPFSAVELERYLDKLQIALMRSAGRHRQVLSPEEQMVQEFGRRLFDTLLNGDVRSRYDVSQSQARAQRKGLRLKLRVQPPELAALPWEFLYDSRQSGYVCLSTNTPIVRYLELPQVLQPLRVELPLRILGMIASPLAAGFNSLDVATEKARLERALQPLQERHLAELVWLKQGDWRSLQRALRRGPWHIFHFIGHGRYNRATGRGELAFEDEAGGVDPMGAESLATLLADHATLRLALLNACESAQAGKGDPFSSVAATLVRRGLPAVLAMQYAITDQAAVEITQFFYEALADGLPVDAAVSEARKALCVSKDLSLEWGIPVLYMHTQDGVLFQFEKRPASGPLSSLFTNPLEAAADEPQTGAAPIQAVVPVEGPRAPVSSVSPQAQSESVRSEQARIAQPDAGVICRPAAQPGSRSKVFWGRIALIAVLLIACISGVCYSMYSWLAPEPGEHKYTAAPSSTKVKPTKIIATVTPLPAPTSYAGSLPQQIVDDFGVEMALIPAGEFQMGSEVGESNEFPVHTVYVDAYYIDVYEATNAQYAACVQAGSCTPLENASSYKRNSYFGDSAYDHYPVVYVDWNRARAYCQWRGGDLPTEAQWEKAARGGLAGKKFPWGDEEPVCQNGATNGVQFNGCSLNDTEAVGNYSPNGYGVYDMAGNVKEWVLDWYGDYSDQPAWRNPLGPSSGQLRVFRGGSWRSGTDHLRSARREGFFSAFNFEDVGLRCAISSSVMTSATQTQTPEPTP